MASTGSNVRPVSINDRRASIALRQQHARSNSTPDEKLTRKTTITTETTTRTKTLDHAAALRRNRAIQQSAPKDKSPTQDDLKSSHAPSPDSRQRGDKPWQPTATLLSPTADNSPLACRVSVPPQARHAPTQLHGPSLADLDLVAQEKAMMDDLLFVLLGFEGQYIVFNSASPLYDPFDERLRLAGPAFQIARGLDPSLRDLTRQILTTASQVVALEGFIEVMSRRERGSVAHALAAAIRKIHKDFLMLIAQLENQHLSDDSFTLHQMSLHLRKSAYIIATLHSVTQEILTENGLVGLVQDDPSDDEDDENDFDNVLAALNGQAGPRKKSCIGGALLNLLSKRLQSLSGDPQANDLLTSLFKAACIPYVRMLNEWLHHGNVKDPHSEFMINETKSHNREKLAEDYTDDYWEKRYTLRQDHIPVLLVSSADKILLAGKYLNVVRECSSNEIFSQDFNKDLSDASKLPQDIYDTALLPSINTAYYHANAALMRLLMTTHHLSQRLRSLKHWFFLDCSDWFTHFLEVTQNELRRHAKAVNVNKLQVQFDIVLHTPGSATTEDFFGDDISVVFAESALTTWLMRIVNVQGMDADASALTNSYTPAAGAAAGKDEDDLRVHQVLMLDTVVPFPLSLIISRVTLTRYQVLFRYLLSIKYLEHQLIACWSEAGGIGSVSRRAEKKQAKYTDINVWRRRTGQPKVEQWKRRAWRLRSRMLIFVQQLLFYCTAEVIEPRWKSFTEGHKPAEDRESSSVQKTVDELMQSHVDFLGSCLQECMLTNSKLLRINSKVTSTCAHFANYAASFTRSLDRIAPAESNVVNEDELNKLSNILTQYEQHFERHLKILLDALNYLAATENASFLLLCARLSIALEGGVNGRPSPAAVDGADIG